MKINFRDDKYLEQLDKVLNTYTSEELLNELVKCRLELNKNKEDVPWTIETEEELDNLIQAMRKAAAAPTKNIIVVYQDITDEDEIKQIFN